jgi:hypothetical protein
MKARFPWGEVIKTHQIGEFTITEYKVNPVFKTEQEVEFSTGSASYDTLDQAIIGAICAKYDQPEAEYYIWKMLN